MGARTESLALRRTGNRVKLLLATRVACCYNNKNAAVIFTVPPLVVTRAPSEQVSVIGHSLGSIIAHDILMAQPVRGGTELAEDAVSKDIPLLR